MKWRLATLSLLAVNVLLLAVAAQRGWLPRDHQVFSEGFTGSGVEVGYYNVAGKQQERYVPFFAVQPDGVLMSLASKEDSQFVANVMLVPQARTRIGYLYSYQPMVFQSSSAHPLVQSAFSFMAHNGVTLNRLDFEGNRVLIMPSGLIINQQQ